MTRPKHRMQRLAIRAVMTLALLMTPQIVFAQQVTGELGSPSAPTTINGRQLPPPPPTFGGKIERNALQSTP